MHVWRRGLSSIFGAIVMLTIAFAARAFAADIGAVVNNHPAAPANIHVIYLKDLVKLMADPNSHVRIYDANPPGVRRSEGMIPGARPLSSADNYNVADELPSNHNAKLVFYCHNLL
jgi:flagellin-like protein